MAGQVPAVCDVLAAIERRNWDRLRLLLNPDVHWTTAVEEHGLNGPRAERLKPWHADVRWRPRLWRQSSDTKM